MRNIFLIVFLAICLSCSTSFAALVTTNHNFISVSNDSGVKYDMDGAAYGGPSNTYYIKGDGGGVNELKLSSTTTGGDVTSAGTTSTNASGTLYVTNTGGRGFDNDIILLVSVKGPISDDFSLHITSGGYTWTPSPVGSTNPGIASDVAHVTGIDETFTKNDFLYGPQVKKPAPDATGQGQGNLPLFVGQDTTDNSTAEYLMFIDLYVGNIKKGQLLDSNNNPVPLVDDGAAKIDFSFTGIASTAAINAYGWCSAANQGEGINWTNDTNANDAAKSGYSINYNGPPVVISTTPAVAGTNIPTSSIISAAFNSIMNSATITADSFTVQSPSGPVSGTLSYDPSSNTATFTPSAMLNHNTTYTVTVTSGVTDLSGNPLSAKTWSFTTDLDVNPPYVTSTSPADGATEVATGTGISATFNGPMDLNSLDNSTFTLTGPGGAVTGTVTYNAAANTAVFTPASSLANDVTYTAVITSGVRNLAGTAMATQYSWTFTTTPAPDTTPPTVSFTSPSGSATDVPVDTVIGVSFSEAMDGSTITSTSFTVSDASGAIAGSLNYDTTTHIATFTPAALQYATTYTATVTTDVTDQAGNHMASPHTWTFVTGPAPDTTPPTVSATSPAGGNTGVSINSAVTVSFSEAVNSSTVNKATFTLRDASGTVTGSVSYNSANNTATFIPSAPLTYGSTYTATITTDVTDLAGNHIASPYSWTFDTLPIPDPTPPAVNSSAPADGSLVASINSHVTVVFSKVMDSSTINATTFTVSDSTGGTIAGSVSYDSSNYTATFTPAAPLTYSSTYTANVTTGVRDIYNIAMTGGKSWTFTTAPPYGDLEGSGADTNLNDALIALRIAAGVTSPTQQQMAAGDVAPLINGKPQPDGKINVGDVLVILLKVVGLLNL